VFERVGVEESSTEYLKVILRAIGFALLGFYLIRYPVTRLALENRKTGKPEKKHQPSTPLQGE
jgi:hypothetical protein